MAKYKHYLNAIICDCGNVINADYDIDDYLCDFEEECSKYIEVEDNYDCDKCKSKHYLSIELSYRDGEFEYDNHHLQTTESPFYIKQDGTCIDLNVIPIGDNVDLSDGIFFFKDKEYHVINKKLIHVFNNITDNNQLTLFGDDLND